MNLFESVKDTVSTRAAAEMYGLQVDRKGFCKCPFHADKNPSMKTDKRYHCFGCNADGDVIAFAARLFSLSPKDLHNDSALRRSKAWRDAWLAMVRY